MIVVAGVTGHVGSVVADRLLGEEARPRVRVIVRDGIKGARWAKRDADLAVGALDDEAFLTDALRGADAFFTLLPPNYGAPDFRAAQRKTADAIAGAVRASGVPSVVLLSSVGADLPSGTGPISGLHDLEEALRATGLKLVALRACSFQENVANAIPPAKNLGIYPNFNPSADLAVPMIATKDIGTIAADCLMAPPARSEVVDLEGPAYSSRQIADKLGAALGKTLRVVDIPPEGWVGALMQAGMPQSLAEIFAEMYAAAARGALRPRGDRLEHGHTPIDEVIRTLV